MERFPLPKGNGMLSKSLRVRVALGGLLVAGMVLFTTGEVQSQKLPKLPPPPTPLQPGTVPNRPYINLVNNASLYTFKNPNANLPSQLPYAFVAVAHEDCRLYNNGAMLLPMIRLQAAECINGGNGTTNQNPPPAIICVVQINGTLACTFNGIPIPQPPPGTQVVIVGGPGPVQGTKFSRISYDPSANYNSYSPSTNYSSYQPSSTTSTSAGSSSVKYFGGFGSFSEASLSFSLMATSASAQFGNGFANIMPESTTMPREASSEK